MPEEIELTEKNIRKIGTILYKIRQKREVSQGYMSRKMGKSGSQISLMENNVKAPNVMNLFLFLKAVNCRLVIILEDTKIEPVR